MPILVNGKPLTVLTNGDCEDTGFWTLAQFEAFGLDWGEWNGEDYPLTDEEAVYISYDNRVTPAGGDFLFGYSALYEGQKWAMPSIEYMHPVDLQGQQEEQRLLEELVAPYRGRVVLDEEGPEDRLTVLILVPFSALQEAFNDVHDWQRYLERGLGIEQED